MILTSMVLKPHYLIPLNGIITWLDSSDTSTMTFNGGDISAWKCKINTSSVSYNQTTAARQPTYNSTKKALYFANYEYLELAGNTLYNGPYYTEFIILEPAVNIGTGSRIIIRHGYNTSTTLTAMFSESNLIRFHSRNTSNGFIVSQLSVGSGVYALNELSMLYGAWKSDNTVNLESNEIVATAGTGANNAAKTHTISRIGSQTSSISQFFYGYIYEIIIYKRDLDSSEKTQVYNYLKNKYGL